MLAAVLDRCPLNLTNTIIYHRTIVVLLWFSSITSVPQIYRSFMKIVRFYKGTKPFVI